MTSTANTQVGFESNLKPNKIHIFIFNLFKCLMYDPILEQFKKDGCVYKYGVVNSPAQQWALVIDDIFHAAATAYAQKDNRCRFFLDDPSHSCQINSYMMPSDMCRLHM